MHVHPGTKEDVIDTGGKYIEDALNYFGQQIEVLSIEALADRYRALDLMGVLLAWDAETNTGNPRLSNEYIAEIVKKYPETFVGFCRGRSLERKSGHRGGGICDPRARPSRH